MAIVVTKEFKPSEITDRLVEKGYNVSSKAIMVVLEHHVRRDQIQIYEVVPQKQKSENIQISRNEKGEHVLALTSETVKIGTIQVSRNKEGDKILEEFNFRRFPEYRKTGNKRVYKVTKRA